jgi:hypothetical protein
VTSLVSAHARELGFIIPRLSRLSIVCSINLFIFFFPFLNHLTHTR